MDGQQLSSGTSNVHIPEIDAYTYVVCQRCILKETLSSRSNLGQYHGPEMKSTIQGEQDWPPNYLAWSINIHVAKTSALP